MEKLRNIIERNDTKWGRVFDLSIQALIILSLVSFSLDTLPNLSDRFRRVLDTIETFVVVIFSVEYVLRIIVTRKKLRFIFSFYGLIDLAAILPFYLASGVDLRSIRAFRFFRIVRALKLVRYTRALAYFRNAVKEIKEELILFLLFTFILLFVAAAGIYFFENPVQPEVYKSIFDSLWWAIVTLTTVGYGDMYPITTGGKIFTFIILLIGLGVVAIPTGLFASALNKVRERIKGEMKEKE